MKLAFEFYETQMLPDIASPPGEVDVIMDDGMSESDSVIEDEENISDAGEVMEDTDSAQGQEEADAIADDEMSESDSVIEEGKDIPDTAEATEEANSTLAQEESDITMDDGTPSDSIEDQDVPRAASRAGKDGEVLLTDILPAAVLPKEKVHAQTVGGTANISLPDASSDGSSAMNFSEGM